MKYLSKADSLHIALTDALAHVPFPSAAAEKPAKLLQRCPAANETPLCDVPALAAQAGVARVSIKDERGRMALGSFKALGAAYVIAADAELGQARGKTYITASAGNHGLSVAAGAQAFGAHAVIYLSETVPAAFAGRLEKFGAEVRRAGATYEESMLAATEAAQARGDVLLSDSSWHGYFDRPHRLMEGYTVLMHETAGQIARPPSHIFLQAGVGGLAAAAAAYARRVWGDTPFITVVEPDAAPALFSSIKAGSPLVTQGPVSAMGRLDCKEPSLIALKGLARDADAFMTITEAEGQLGAEIAGQCRLPASPSGAAGIAGLVAACSAGVIPGLGRDAEVLLILSEGLAE